MDEFLHKMNSMKYARFTFECFNRYREEIIDISGVCRPGSAGVVGRCGSFIVRIAAAGRLILILIIVLVQIQRVGGRRFRLLPAVP